MQLEDLSGKNLTLIGARTTYRNGAEHISLRFKDKVSEEEFSVSFSAERGSDLWTTIKRIKKVKKLVRLPGPPCSDPECDCIL